MQWLLCTPTLSSNLILSSFQLESSIFIEDAIKYFQDKVSTQSLILLVTNDEAWNEFVATAELTRDEADEFRKALNKLAEHVIRKDKNWQDKDQQHRKWFLKEFPHLKRDLQDHIIKLYILADGGEQVHRGTTITNVVSSTAGVISDILTLLGLGLAPLTDGVSLVLSETGMGTGIVAAVTGITSSIVEQAKKLSVQRQAGNLDQRDPDVAKVMKELMSENTPNFLSLADNSYQVIQGIGKDIRAIREARANSQLVPSARPLEIIGISAESDEEVERVTEIPALEMSRGNKALGVATGGILLVLDVVSLVYESKHLQEGAKSELAEELKKRAQELEGKLNILTKIQEILQADQEL
uniref:apolipoprotein L2 n=1 Tax=Macaca mulatta TaxID=9544 RepID=UPI0007327C90|nr:apolipoprotein L2 [Macaca mulatta]